MLSRPSPIQRTPATDHLQLALKRPGVVPKPHRLKRLVDAELGRPRSPNSSVSGQIGHLKVEVLRSVVGQ